MAAVAARGSSANLDHKRLHAHFIVRLAATSPAVAVGSGVASSVENRSVT
jgi:hypothetical protein